MTFEQLESFIAAVKAPTFFDAAESLHITQSTLSKQIMKLERELNVTLFDRSRRSAALTDAGKAFYEEALLLTGQYHKMLSRMKQFQAASAQNLRIGTLPVLSQYRLTGVLRKFSSCHPEISLSIEEAEDPELLGGLEDGRFDFIIIRSLKTDPEKHRFQVLANDRLAAILPEDHPLAEASSVTLSQLSGESFLLMPPHTSIHGLCIRLFEEAGISPMILRTARMESILDAVAVHEGISLFAEANFNLFSHPFTVAVPLEPPAELSIGMAGKKNAPLSPAARIFINFIQSALCRNTAEKGPESE